MRHIDSHGYYLELIADIIFITLTTLLLLLPLFSAGAMLIYHYTTLFDAARCQPPFDTFTPKITPLFSIIFITPLAAGQMLSPDYSLFSPLLFSFSTIIFRLLAISIIAFISLFRHYAISLFRHIQLPLRFSPFFASFR
jgi:hypothetical protein